ncbi:MAG: invasion associated locus B family protein [Paracoccaceae bacterium]
MLKHLTIAATVLLSSQTAFAQDQKGWVESCQPDSCTLSRGLAEEGTGKQVMTLLLAIEKGKPDVRFGVALPLGVALSPGVRVIHGDKTTDIPFEVCFPDGCRALITMDAATFAAFAANASVDVRFFPFSASTPVALTAPMDGLADAVTAAAQKLDGTP